jgi:choline dehydrogenase
LCHPFVSEFLTRIPGGRCLGGSSAINGLFYGRGTTTVYDAWESLGNPGWGSSEIWPLFVKGTHFNTPDHAQGFDMSYKTWDADSYGDGPLQLAFQGYVPESAVAFVGACAEAANMPVVRDLNSGNGTGVKQGTGTLDARLRRSSSYDAYYKPVRGRGNLDVLFYAPVQSIMFDDTNGRGGKPKAKGVAFVDHPTGLVHEVRAAKEVILSMGAFHSPQLLMVSGIGPAATLGRFGIDPVVANENVGRHLDDHSVFSVMATAEPAFSTSQVGASFASLRAAQDQFYGNGTGPYSAPSGITNGFQMLGERELREIGAGAVVDAGLTGQAHVEYLYESIWYPGGPTPYYTPKSNESYISLTASSLVALSRGNVTIRSTSMADYPIINPNVRSLVQPPVCPQRSPSLPVELTRKLVLRPPRRPRHRHPKLQISPQNPQPPHPRKVPHRRSLARPIPRRRRR